MGSVAAIIFIDQVLFRYLAPNFKINRFRLGINFLKYVIAPSAIAATYKFVLLYLGLISWAIISIFSTPCRKSMRLVSINTWKLTKSTTEPWLLIALKNSSTKEPHLIGQASRYCQISLKQILKNERLCIVCLIISMNSQQEFIITIIIQLFKIFTSSAILATRQFIQLGC